MKFKIREELMELGIMTEWLDAASTKYGMEISAEKTRLMTNSAQSITTKITVSGKELETVDQRHKQQQQWQD